jgi:serine O-acetyltransferase
MVLGARSIGNDVHIRQNTTFGIARRDQLNGKPMIGDRVDIGCGAAILGHVVVGNDSVIGANAVVVRDVPPDSLAVGVPARVVERRQSRQAVALAQRAGGPRAVPEPARSEPFGGRSSAR